MGGDRDWDGDEEREGGTQSSHCSLEVRALFQVTEMQRRRGMARGGGGGGFRCVFIPLEGFVIVRERRLRV